MANTVIALKKSSTPSAVPTNLANGELAINFADGILYYKAANGTIASIQSGGANAFGTVNANNVLVVADVPNDILTLVSGNNIVVVGDAINDKITVSVKDNPTFTGDVSGGRLLATGASGDEGGEIVLATALTNNNLSTSVTVDIYQNKLRFFETGGTNRGAYIDLGIAGTGVSSNLLSAGGGTALDTVARDWATAAFVKANTSNITADRAWNHANAAFITANIAFANANIVMISAQAAFTVANSGFIHANAAYAFANSISLVANAAFLHANAAFANGNTVIQTAQSAITLANIAYLHANQAFDKANTSNITADLAFTHANNAYAKANAANVTADNALPKSGGTITGDLAITGALTVSGNTFRLDANTLIVSDPLIYLAGNNYTSDIVDIGFVANYVNATGQNVHTGLFRDATTKEYYVFEGYDKEPVPNHIDIAGNNFTISVLNATLKTSNLILGGTNTIPWITAAFVHANAAHTSANAGMSIANGAFASANAGQATANAAFNRANTANITADRAWNHANAAFITANIAFANANTVMISAQAAFTVANASFLHANAAYAFANSISITSNLAFAHANAAFAKANTVLVGNTNSGIYSLRSTRKAINLIPGNNIAINVDDDATGDRANVTITASVSGGGDPTFAYVQANTARDHANSAYAQANAAYDKANTGGSGGGGGGAPTTNVITANAVVAIKDNRYFLTNTSFTTVTLPASPSVGDTIYIVVTNGLANNIVARNGNRIMSLTEDLTLDINYYSLGLTYVTTTLGWVII